MKTFIKILLLATFILNHSALTIAQNLVPNPSFEEYSECPIGASYADNINYWHTFRIQTNTPDYFNVCATQSSEVSVPSNLAGNICPFYGKGYVGIFSYAYNIPNYREMLYCKLTDSLIIGNQYYISFTISSTIYDYYNCCINNIGCLFTTYNDTSINIINNYSQIKLDSVINTNNKWKTYNFSFIADSSYKYLFVGNFFDDSHTSYNVVVPQSSLNFSYYYIDYIVVSEDSTDLVLSKEDIIYPVVSNIINLDSSITFTLDSNYIYTNYNWNFEGGTPSYSNLPNPLVYYHNTGTFDVTLIASNISGCNDTLYYNDLINVINSDGINDFSSNFSIINNPSNNFIILESKTNIDLKNIFVYDILGKQIQTNINKSNGLIKITLNQNTKNGVYILKITNNKNQSFNKKFVKF